MRMSKGVKYMLLASFFFAIMYVLVKLVPNIPSVEIVFFRSVVSLILSYALLKRKRVNIWGNNKRVLMIRGLSGAIALTLFFITIQAIPLASAVTIQYLSPIFTAILGIYIVKEKVKPLQWVFFILAFVGIVIIQGFDARVSTTYVIIGVLSALLSGVAYNCIRKLKQSEHPLVIVFYFPLVTLPLAGLYLFYDSVMPRGWEWLILIAIGVATQFAQFYMTKAYQSDELSKVASINYIGILYALGFGFVLFHESFSIEVYLGIAVVLSGVILNVWYKQRSENMDTAKAN